MRARAARRRVRAFDHGVFPAKDGWVYEFDQRYLRDVGDDARVEGQHS